MAARSATRTELRSATVAYISTRLQRRDTVTVLAAGLDAGVVIAAGVRRRGTDRLEISTISGTFDAISVPSHLSPFQTISRGEMPKVCKPVHGACARPHQHWGGHENQRPDQSAADKCTPRCFTSSSNIAVFPVVASARYFTPSLLFSTVYLVVCGDASQDSSILESC